jgi:hypothetical protein
MLNAIANRQILRAVSKPSLAPIVIAIIKACKMGNVVI